MKRTKLYKALLAAFRHGCATEDWNPYKEAFKAVYGAYPVYIPQH